MFKKLTVAQRLGSAFVFLGLGLMTSIVLSFLKLSSMKAEMDLLAKDRVPKILLVNAVHDASNQTARAMRNVLLARGEDAAAELENLQASRKKVTENLERLNAAVKSEKGRALFQAVIEARKPYGAGVDKMLALAKEGRKEEAVTLLFTEVRTAQRGFFAALEEITKFQLQAIDQSIAEAEEEYQRAVWSMTVAAIVLLLVAGSAAALTIRNIIRQLGGEPDVAAEIAHAIAAGDLTHPVPVRPRDTTSMLAAMKEMQDKLTETVRKIQDEAERVSSTAEQLAVSSNQVAESSRHQSAAAASMAASVEELTVSIDQVAERAGEAARISNHSGDLSQQGGAVIDRATQEMQAIEQSVKASSEIIQVLEQQSNSISAIVNVIEDIADQTNLLALNAAIEAARAGESGRGFAVVADEVRKLSERTSQSTHEIAAMIQQIQEGTHRAVTSMESGVEQANRGVVLANEAGSSIVEIKTEASRVVNVVDDISHSLREQSTASADIARNVETIAQMTEENSAAVTETSAAAHHLEQMAMSLQQTVSHFRVA